MDKYDIYLFLGQSNMAGRGITNKEFPESFPEVLEGAGYEYRAVTAPGKLSELREPFGVEENREDGINDRWGDVRAKSGSMVASFVNAYFEKTGIPVIGLSASKGGSMIGEWIPGTPYYNDLTERIDSLKAFLAKEDIEVNHMNVLFCQGESDADRGTENWTESFNTLKEMLFEKGFENIFMIPIGRMNVEGKYHQYDGIRNEQYSLIESDDRIILASPLLETMLDRGLMKDQFHYYQKAYNEVGKDAATNVANYLYNK